MSKFNIKQTSKTENLAGGIAYKHSPEMELVISCVSTFLENKFYESGNDRIERIKNLCSQVKAEFISKLAIFCCKEFHLRSVSHLLVATLSKIHRGDDLVMKTILEVSERPDDLIEIVAILEGKLPKQVKRGIRRALLKFNRYQLSKYKMENKKVSLVDLFNLCHPNPKFANEEQKKAWSDLIKGELKNEETWEARLSFGENKEKVWRDLILENKIGYMALLRNLRNIDNQADDETKKISCEIISNQEKVRTSKQLPFRFYNAYQNVENQNMLEAIEKALEISLDNVPRFEGKTLIAIDGSGSMMGEPIKKSSIFASALMKSNDADVCIYDTGIKGFRYLKGEPVLTLAERIQRETDGGGTNTSLVFDYAKNNGIKYDRIIIISDNESWQEIDTYWGSRNTNQFYNEYKKENDCFIYAIDIEGYGTKDIKGDKVFHLSGWSEKIFDFIKWIEKENQLVEFVNGIELN